MSARCVRGLIYRVRTTYPDMATGMLWRKGSGLHRVDFRIFGT